MSKASTSAGFSLIEMAFVLVIVTLLLGGLLVPFTTQVEQRRIAETQKAMEEIKEALLGYAIANGRLPCPDMTIPNGLNANDGIEDPLGGGPCIRDEGNLPWVTLGLGSADSWGNHFRYRVTPAFTIPGGISLGPPSTVGVLQVCSTHSVLGACPAGTVIANNIPAVVLSYGKNGFGAINANYPAGNVTTILCPLGGCSSDEQENVDGNAPGCPGQPSCLIFVSRTSTSASAIAGEFDDIVTWISPNVLFNRMVAAGKLP